MKLIRLLGVLCATLSLIQTSHGMSRFIRKTQRRIEHRIFGTDRTPVYPNDISKIVLRPTELQEKTISTGGLLGCYTNIVYAQRADKTQYAIMAHYAPKKFDDHVAALSQALTELKNDSRDEPFKLITFIICPPGNLTINAAGQATLTVDECEEQYKKEVEAFARLAQAKIPPTETFEIVMQPYGNQIILSRGFEAATVRFTMSNNTSPRCGISNFEIDKEFEL